MKQGEKVVVALIACLLIAGLVRSQMIVSDVHDKDIPFYSTATPEIATKATDIIRSYNCKSCHSLWTLKDTTQSVPAPMLDGMGSLHTEAWLFDYLSSGEPQSIQPSRLKKEYRMPSYAELPENERRLLAQYLSSLKVQDWYLEETKKAEYEKLTGLEYHK